MRPLRAVTLASLSAALLLAGCSTSDTGAMSSAEQPQATASSPAASSEPSSTTPSDPASETAVDPANPEGREIIHVPVNQTEITVPVGVMIDFDVKKNSKGGWSSTGDYGDAVESEEVFIGDSMENNPYWGLYKTVAPGTATIYITVFDDAGQDDTTYEYIITVE